MWLFRRGEVRRLNANHSVPGELAEIVSGGDTAEELVDRILRAVEAHERTFQDNATLIAIRLPMIGTDEAGMLTTGPRLAQCARCCRKRRPAADNGVDRRPHRYDACRMRMFVPDDRVEVHQEAP